MLISATELLTTTSTMYRRNFGSILRFLGISLCVWGLVALNSVVALGYFIRWFGLIPGQIVAVIIQAFLLCVFLVLTLAFNRIMAKRYLGDMASTFEVEIVAAKKLFWPFLGSSILTGLIVFSGSLLLLIPGAFFALWYYYAPFGVMLDNLKIRESLRASHALVAGRLGAVLWRLGIPILIYAAIFKIVMWMIITPGRFFLLTSGSQSAYWLSIFLGILFYFFFLPVVTIMPIVLYENLKRTPVEKAS